MSRSTSTENGTQKKPMLVGVPCVLCLLCSPSAILLHNLPWLAAEHFRSDHTKKLLEFDQEKGVVFYIQPLLVVD